MLNRKSKKKQEESFNASQEDLENTSSAEATQAAEDVEYGEEELVEEDYPQEEKSLEEEAKDEEASALAEAKEEIERLKESRLRLMAEYDNFKRRSQKEKERIYGDCIVDVAVKWLPILDNLERAGGAADALDEDSDQAKIQAVVDGIDLIQKQAEEALERLGIEEIEALDQKFDPNLHEAVMRIDSDDHEEETVVEVFAKGYKYKDRVIRHAVVQVAN